MIYVRNPRLFAVASSGMVRAPAALRATRWRHPDSGYFVKASGRESCTRYYVGKEDAHAGPCCSAVRTERQSASTGVIAAATKVGKLGTRTANGIQQRLVSSNGEFARCELWQTRAGRPRLGGVFLPKWFAILVRRWARVTLKRIVRRHRLQPGTGAGHHSDPHGRSAASHRQGRAPGWHVPGDRPRQVLQGVRHRRTGPGCGLPVARRYQFAVRQREAVIRGLWPGIVDQLPARPGR